MPTQQMLLGSAGESVPTDLASWAGIQSNVSTTIKIEWDKGHVCKQNEPSTGWNEIPTSGVGMFMSSFNLTTENRSESQWKKNYSNFDRPSPNVLPNSVVANAGTGAWGYNAQNIINSPDNYGTGAYSQSSDTTGQNMNLVFTYSSGLSNHVGLSISFYGSYAYAAYHRFVITTVTISDGNISKTGVFIPKGQIYAGKLAGVANGSGYIFYPTDKAVSDITSLTSASAPTNYFVY